MKKLLTILSAFALLLSAGPTGIYAEEEDYNGGQLNAAEMEESGEEVKNNSPYDWGISETYTLPDGKNYVKYTMNYFAGEPDPETGMTDIELVIYYINEVSPGVTELDFRDLFDKSSYHFAPEKELSIDDRVFDKCVNLSKLIIPNLSKTTVPCGYLSHCPKITTAGPIGGGYDLEFGCGDTIPYDAFALTPNLTEVTLPDGITEIRNNAFMGCENLKSINIPDGVTCLNIYAFAGCTSLEKIDIPDSVTILGPWVFYGCTSLKEIRIPEKITELCRGEIENCSGLETVWLPGGITEITSGSFSNCTSLKTVYFNGTRRMWNKIKIGENNNDPLFAADIICLQEDKAELFVERLYELCMGREADPEGLDTWTEALINKKMSAAQVVQGFFLSEEMKNKKLSNEDYVETCYKVMMNRDSDASGKKNWVEMLNNGMSYNAILRGFIGSAEFTAICKDYEIDRGMISAPEPRDQNYGITSFVARCYEKVLGRKYDVNGLNGWCRMILNASQKKQTAVTVATKGFFTSKEFIAKNTSDEEYVNILYQTFLDREADAGGFKDWTGRLKKGTSRYDVMMGFANSVEFARLMAKYNIR